MGYLIKNGNVHMEKGEAMQMDLRIKENLIAEIGGNLQHDGEIIIDAQGYLVSPGFLDLHSHLREPGGEHKETIETGTKAAAKGGFTTIASMPNTNPILDTPEKMEDMQKRIKKTGLVRVLPYAAISTGLKGGELTDFEGLKANGAFAFTDDGVGVQNAGMMYEAMKRAAALDMAVVAHCEDNSLIYGGAFHEGEFSREHTVKGIPSICEAVQIARDVLLAEAAGCHYHVCHISSKESVRVVRDAKKAGIRVTAEVTPHHLLLCDQDIPGLDTNYKMNPPLRSEADRNALIEGLLDGTIDFIATDHAPHSQEEKQKGIYESPFGIVGFETAFPLLYTHFVEKGVFTLAQLLEWITVKPASVFSLPFGRLEEGKAADITLVDLKHTKVVDSEKFLSKGKNTPFNGWECKGWPAATIVNGTLVWKEEGVKC
ncbi:dihydroorotase [Heyndrickxia acidicola]|uniref:Dihydroorotase n=1 Tax=Heyndrickxia acidicola TaxID=209389 RepID=A0ABU6MFU8_9BACI|nr:dihydroorotase [Heyndrickxia acidicola]MED1202142.1 dihydroorotase [Heyndrickxia acidicola]